MFEKYVKQKINDVRFAKIPQRYEVEQRENAKKIKAIELELRKSEGRQMDVDTFLEPSYPRYHPPELRHS